VRDVPLGPPVRSTVFLVSAPGDGLYVIDDELCPPDDPDCEEWTGEDDGGADGPGDGTAGDDTDGERPSHPWADAPDDGSGCGCTQGSPATPAAWALALLALALRRRRSA
jgi:MYXO-CTERM domain-containing protein